VFTGNKNRRIRMTTSSVPVQAMRTTTLGESKFLYGSGSEPIAVARAIPAISANSPRVTLFENKKDASNTAAVTI